MKKTIRKLAEAEFFLTKMEENYLEHKEFEYYLSAFISSSRSVLWILKAEHKSNIKWLEWYDKKLPNAEEKVLLKNINELRVQSEKHTPIEPRLLMTITMETKDISDELMDLLDANDGSPAREPNVMLFKKDDPPENIDSKVVPTSCNVGKVFKAVHGFEEEDVIDVCKKYFQTVSEIVDESKRIVLPL